MLRHCQEQGAADRQLLRAETVAHKGGASWACLWLVMRRISSFPGFGFDKQINNKTRAAHAPLPLYPTSLSPSPLTFPALIIRVIFHCKQMDDKLRLSSSSNNGQHDQHKQFPLLAP